MSRGVIFFNRGSKCTIRMLISIFTLRKHYHGPITLIAMGVQPVGFLECILQLRVDILYIKEREIKTLAQKTSLYRHSPYDLSLFIDADMICLNPIDKIWDIIREHKWVSYGFEDWVTTGGQMRKRIRNMRSVCPELVEDALAYGRAVNTGIFGFTQDSTMLPELEELAEKTWRAGVNNVITDEIAAQMLLPKHPSYLMSKEWGISGKFGKITDDTVFVHYHGKKSYEEFPNCHLYKQIFWECYRETGWEFLLSNQGLRRENRYLRKIKGRDYTVVTAVDRKYLPKLKENFKKWVKTEGVMEMPLICFYDGDSLEEWELAFLGKTAKLVKWTFPIADTQREKMLSSFVFGAAEHVKTKYWLKLDCDSYPVNEVEHGYRFDLPEDYKDYYAIGNKCGYCKGVGFLPKLDNWGDKAIPKAERLYDHLTEEQKTKWLRVPTVRRFASYCCLYRTSFTKWLANNCYGRLPIPSEDSLTSYALARANKPFKSLRMKRWFSPRG